MAHFSKHMTTELPNDGDKCNNVTVYVCWKWKDTVTRHDCLELLCSQWRKQMGTAEQQERMLRHNCDQWRIPCPSTRTEINNVLLDNNPEALTFIQPRYELKLWIQNNRNEFGSFLECKTAGAWSSHHLASRLSTEGTMYIHKALLQNMYYQNWNLRHNTNVG
jgi:hypothetical protein